MSIIKQAISNHLDKYIVHLRNNGIEYPEHPWDEDTLSVLYIGEKDEEGYIQWIHKEKATKHSLSDIEDELDVNIHKSVHEYFNSYWFFQLNGVYSNEPLEFLSVPPGLELFAFTSLARGYKDIKGNLDHVPIGFHGKTDLPIVINNATGEVFIEDHERGTYQKIADGLAELISEMEP